MLELIIDKNKKIETICLVENGKLVEKYQNDDETSENRLEGNIYVGKVTNLIPGMQSAFVDFGVEKNGLIHLKDAIPQVDEKVEKINEKIEIKDILKKDQKLLVQVKKDCNEKKGARLSTHITLPGKYIVYMPNTSFITISQKIDDNKKKKELIELVKTNIKKRKRSSYKNCSNDSI